MSWSDEPGQAPSAGPAGFTRRLGRVGDLSDLEDEDSCPAPPPQNHQIPAAKAFSLHGACITVKVGPETSPTTDFLIHRDVIAQSAYFASMLGGGFAESSSGIIRLVEDDPTIFGIYANYLYRSIVSYDVTSPTSKDQAEQRQEHYDLLIRAYLFGDKIVHIGFMNKVMDEIARLHSVNVGGSVLRLEHANIQLVWENVAGDSSHSPLKRLIIDEDVYYGGRIWFWMPKFADDFSPAYLLELTAALMADKGRAKVSGRETDKPPHAKENLGWYHVVDKSKGRVKINIVPSRSEGAQSAVDKVDGRRVASPDEFDERLLREFREIQ